MEISALAASQAAQDSLIRSHAIEAARATSGVDRAICVHIARIANRAVIHAKRTAREAQQRFINVDMKPRSEVKRRVMAEARRVMDRRRDLGPPATRVGSASFWAGLVLFVCSCFMFLFALGVLAGRADAATLDLEISAGVNVSEYLSGAGRFNAGRSFDGGFAGPRDTCEFSLVWRSNDQRWFVKLSHISHLSAGPPFNRRPEDFLERLEFGYRWRIGGAQ